jgi:hypothetical protein
MSESSYKQHLRRVTDKTGRILDEESQNVGKALGKLAKVCDFSCHDKLGHKIVKVCLDTISRIDLERLLDFDGCRDDPTIIQIFFWRNGEHRPFYRPKLRYNCPKQTIPAELQKLVK